MPTTIAHTSDQRARHERETHDLRAHHAIELYVPPRVQFDRKNRIVRSHQRRDTRRMNTMPAETGPAKAALREPQGGPEFGRRTGHYVRNDVREQLNDLAQWNAVVEHDRGADGLFVYAVRSTGVY